MVSRQNEIYSILGISWGEQSSPAPRTRQEEIFDIVSFPAVSRRTSPNDVGATLAVARPQGSPTGEPWTPQPAAPTAPLSGEPNTSSGAYAPPSPQGEGRSAEQVQQELADSRKQLAQLGADAAYIVTAEQGAELGRQMDEVRARIKALNTELDALKTPNTNAERDSLIQRMNDISAYEGYATTVEQADAVTREKQETRQRLHQLDEELGNAARFYDSGERAPAVIKGALKQTGSAYTNFMGTLQGAGNRLHEASSDFDKAVAGSEYSGWATDELSAANIAASSDGKGLEALEREEQRLYEKADAMAESAARDIEQAKEGLSALGQTGVDVTMMLIQLGIDAAGRAVGLGMLPVFVRAAGSAMQEARHDGASTWEQLAYGLTKGTVEAAGEKIFDGLAGAFGKGVADDIVELLIGKLAKSDTGRTILRAFSGAVGEGLEEVFTDLFDILAKQIYNDQALKEAWENRAELRSQILYDFLLGTAMGSIGSITSIVTGQDAAKNQNLRESENSVIRPQEGTNFPADPGDLETLNPETKLALNQDWKNPDDSPYVGNNSLQNTDQHDTMLSDYPLDRSNIISDGSHIQNGKLKPNCTYTTGEHDYIYVTNSEGLIKFARADELKLKEHEKRLSHSRKTLGKLAGDDAGHLFGDLFGGSPKLDNLVSQARDVNRKQFRKIEKEWEAALNNKQKVSAEIRISYDPGSSRPTEFIIKYSIDGEIHSATIKNTNKGG